MTKFISWNVNGLRAVAGKGFADGDLFLIHFYFELLTCHTEAQAADQTHDTDRDAGNDDNCRCNCHSHLLLLR